MAPRCKLTDNHNLAGRIQTGMFLVPGEWRMSSHDGAGVSV